MISNEDAAKILASLNAIENSIGVLESKIQNMDAKLDDSSLLIARYDERINNNKTAIERNEHEIRKAIEKSESEMKGQLDVVHEQIRISKREAVGEATAKVKIWILISITSAMAAVIASAISYLLKSH